MHKPIEQSAFIYLCLDGRNFLHNRTHFECEPNKFARKTGGFSEKFNGKSVSLFCVGKICAHHTQSEFDGELFFLVNVSRGNSKQSAELSTPLTARPMDASNVSAHIDSKNQI